MIKVGEIKGSKPLGFISSRLLGTKKQLELNAAEKRRPQQRLRKEWEMQTTLWRSMAAKEGGGTARQGGEPIWEWGCVSTFIF